MDRVLLEHSNVTYELDLSESQIKQTNKINDVGKPEAIKSLISKTIQLPKSNNNIRALLNLGYNGSQNLILLQNVIGKLLVENEYMMWKASVYIYDNGINYELILKQGNGNFFDQIKGVSINSLIFDSLLDLWNQTTIISENTNTSGRIWNIIDWGNLDSHPTYMEVKEMYPSVFAKDIFDAIFNSSQNSALSESWSYDGDIFTDDNFLKKLIPCHNQFANDTVRGRAIALALSAEISGITDITYYPELQSVSYDIYGLMQDVLTGGTESPQKGYFAPSDGTYTFNFRLDINNFDRGGTPTAVLSLNYKKNFGSNQELYTTIASSELISVDFTIDLAKDDFINLSVVLKTPSGGESYDIDNVHIRCDVANFEQTEYGLDYPIDGNLPEMTQDDFIKQIMNLYSLIPVPNVDTKTITFEKFEKTKENLNNLQVYDYSDKLDASKPIKNKYELEGFSKTNWFRWEKDDLDQLPVNSGESSFTLTGQNYVGEKDFVKSLFAYSKLKQAFDENIPFIRLLVDGVRENEFKARIYDLDSKTGSVPYRVDGGSEIVETTNLPFVSLVDWSDLQTDYWQYYIDIADNPDTPEMFFLIDPIEFKQFEFFKPIFVKNMGYYQVFSIKNYRNGYSILLKTAKIK